MQTSVTIGQTDMSSVLADIATGSPELIYFPIFMPEGAFIIDQAKTTPGLENTKLMVCGWPVFTGCDECCRRRC